MIYIRGHIIISLTDIINKENNMQEKTIQQILENVGAIVTNGHFVYTSGKHGSVYINKDALYPHTAEASFVGELFADSFRDMAIDVVAAPAIGAIILSQWTAFHLSLKTGKDVLGVYTEKTAANDQVLRRGYDKLVAFKNVLVVEDLTTTGTSVRKSVDAVRLVNGNVVAVGVMVNRNPTGVTSDVVGAPLRALHILEADAYEQMDCPLCRKNIPINIDLGHGKAFLDSSR